MGLRKWVQDNWVDIANKKSDGSYPKCGRSGGETRKNYPKCVPIAKARAMSKGQRASAVKRKQQAGNTGPKPANVPTILKRKWMGEAFHNKEKWYLIINKVELQKVVAL